ncbi:MAG: hypothetical protein IBJ04_13445 [Hydrogenophaga sp.]|uniref:hypothetical protein n=1 Tax=Hydrogenophaga sp. TaxID=1904254 RepID=UPI00257E939C|nr:hypothetical protein [Hydrogenophaga sp.]MBL0945328.1 hypothetical protein [Hydrogenophaga sp.]
MKARPRARGQSSLEYVVVCAALALALGIGMGNDASVLVQLLDALRVAYQRFGFALSLPW